MPFRPMPSRLMPSRRAADVLVEQLRIQGVRDVFCVPGESYLAVLDGLHESGIGIVIGRQEGSVAMMAEATGKLTGRPGVAFVTRGPGATNAAHGVHIAHQDSTPMILFVGQIERAAREREAFQELDYRAVFGSMTKWTTEIDDPARIPELIHRAFAVAMNGRPGPVVIALPEDMLHESIDVPDAPRAEAAPAWPGLTQMAELQKRLWAAERPIVVAGGSRWSAAAVARLVRFSERFGLPVATSLRRQMLFPADHPNYAGDLGIGANPKLVARIKAADLILGIGARFGEMPSQGYSLLPIPGDGARLVHVHPDPTELGRVYASNLPICAAPEHFTAALEGLQPPSALRWHAETEAAHADFLAWTEQPAALSGAFQYGEAMLWLRHTLPADAILTNGAGNYATWLHRYYRFNRFGTQAAPTSGSMGYGLPAAVAAKRLHPERTVVCFAGDGCFLMNGQDFATAVQYDLPIIVLVIDNGMYGTIRMHQEREYPGRVSGTGLKNPDFAAYARAFGGHGETVRETGEFAPAFARAQASGKPAILHCFLDPEAITPSTTISAIRAASLARQGAGKSQP